MNINDVYRRNEKKGYYLFECTHYSLCKFFIDSNLGVNNAPENRTHSISLHVCFVSAFSYPKVSPGDDELVRCWRMRYSRRISDEFISNRIMICLIASSYLPMGFRLILKWVIQCFFFRAFNVFHTIAFCIRMQFTYALMVFQECSYTIFVSNNFTIFTLSIFSSVSSLWFVTISYFRHKTIHIFIFVWSASKKNNSNRIFYGKLSHRLEH